MIKKFSFSYDIFYLNSVRIQQSIASKSQQVILSSHISNEMWMA